MKIFFKFKVLLVVNIFMSFVVLLAMTSASHAKGKSVFTKKELKCFSLIQNKIPWKIHGSKNWSPHNIWNLCKGTTTPAAPGKCFQWALAADNTLDWMKATKLCKGVNYYKNTLACYGREVNKQPNTEKLYSQCNLAGKKNLIIAPKKQFPLEEAKGQKEVFITTPAASSAFLSPSSTEQCVTGILPGGCLKPLPQYMDNRNKEAEEKCFALIQNKIAWNKQGVNTWNASNIKRLCMGTLKAAEPGQCFNQLIQNRTDLLWNWKDASALCAGTDSAVKQINCYSKLKSKYTNRAKVISTCVKKVNRKQRLITAPFV